jgi:hypothetical protein
MPVSDADLRLVEGDPAKSATGVWRRVEGYEHSGLYVMLAPGAGGREEIRGVAVFRDDSPVTAAELGTLPLGQLGRLANAVSETQFLAELQPLYRYGWEDADQFTERVAWYYRFFSSRSSSPAKAIAEHSRVPVRRVHYWIAEARKLGKLPPGRQGKVG